jgi:hypothetical protein
MECQGIVCPSVAHVFSSLGFCSIGVCDNKSHDEVF